MITDESLMPFGKHKGVPMVEVPAGYLIYLYDNNYCKGEVQAYILENLNVLRVEIARAKLKNEK